MFNPWQQYLRYFSGASIRAAWAHAAYPNLDLYFRRSINVNESTMEAWLDYPAPGDDMTANTSY